MAPVFVARMPAQNALPLLGILAVLVCSVLTNAVQAQTATWMDMATVSGTLVPGRVCAVDANGKDLVCDSSMPSTAGLGVTDRIVSDTQKIVVNQTSGVVSLTTGSSDWGYLNPTGFSYLPLLNTTGISSTGAISGTTGNLSGALTAATGSFGGLAVSGASSFGGLVMAHEVSLTQLTASGDVTVTGFVKAARFIGDGSGLSGVPSGDRIVSGTQNVIVNQGSGTVSLTTGGSDWGYLNPTGFSYLPYLNSAGVSSTGMVSGSAGYFAGNVGVGTTAPVEMLTVGSVATPTNIALYENNSNGALRWYDSSGVARNAIRSLTNHAMVFSTSNTVTMMLDGAGRMGVGTGTATPSATLDVSGTLKIAAGVENCDANRLGAIKFSGADFSVCRNGSGWETLTAVANSAQSDRIVSGTTNVIASQDASVTISTAGTQRMVVGTNGNVAIGTATASNTLHVSGTMRVEGGPGFGYFIGRGGTATEAGYLNFYTSDTQRIGYFGSGNASYGFRVGTDVGVPFRITAGATTGNASAFYITSTSLVGIGTVFPVTRLAVSGTLKISNGGEACDSDRLGGLRYNGATSQFEICRNGSAWETMVAGGSGTVQTDRITSGTLGVVANTDGNVVSLTTSNVDWGYLRSSGFSYLPYLNSAGVSSTGTVSGTGGYFAGNVGVGTTAPSATLHVSGTAMVAKVATSECSVAADVGKMYRKASNGRFAMCDLR